MHTIAYASTATVHFSDKQLRALLVSARAHNSCADITGALLYRNGRFIQVLEGPKDAVREIYAKIIADPRHYAIHLVTDEPIENRRFASWTMGYRPLSDTELTEVDGFDDSHATNPTKFDRSDATRKGQTLFDWLNEHWLMPDPALPTPAKKLWGRQPEQSVSGPDTKKDQLQTSSVVKAIFDSIMSDVHNGVLLPGDHVSDTALSLALGTSRTPVREALQQLRTIGVVEASASRFTRIAVIDGEQAANSILVLAALYGAVLTEVIGRVGDHVIDAMRADNAAFRDSLEIGDPAKIAVTGARFYMQLVTESKNVPLRQSIESVIHVVTLGNQHLDQIVGNAVLAESQEILLAATIAGHLAEARRALEMLTPVPLVST